MLGVKETKRQPDQLLDSGSFQPQSTIIKCPFIVLSSVRLLNQRWLSLYIAASAFPHINDHVSTIIPVGSIRDL